MHTLSAGSDVGTESDGDEASGLAAAGQRPQVSFLTAVLMAVALTFHSLLEVRACGYRRGCLCPVYIVYRSVM
jgi:hypothetical protein